MAKTLKNTEPKPHSSHWGVFSGQWVDDRLVVRPHPQDPDPNPIIENFPEALNHRVRIAKPMVRRGWLERGPGKDPRRGRDEFVPMEWPEALDLLAGELSRVRDTHGPGAIFGGSYGWSSAGRFHHAQSQVHRFLNVARAVTNLIGNCVATLVVARWDGALDIERARLVLERGKESE